MRHKRRIISTCVGCIIGFLMGQLFTSCTRKTTTKNDEKHGNKYNSDQSLKQFPDLEAVQHANMSNFILGRAAQHPVSPGKTQSSPLLLVGVMTARKFLNTRTLAAYKTWVPTIPGRVIFFSSEDSAEDAPSNIPVVALPRVKDDYPPQKKSFAMLKYMYDFLLKDGYEYFMRADDDIYIKGDALGKFLRSINSKAKRLIGQSGRGSQDSAEQRNTYGLRFDENYCMGGTGVILSSDTLSAIGPHLKICLQNLWTKHEDIEISRCIRHYTGLSCSWAYQMMYLFYNHGGSFATGREADDMPEVRLDRAMIIHPVKNHTKMYKLHHRTLARHVFYLRQKLEHLRAVISEMDKLILNQESSTYMYMYAETTKAKRAIPIHLCMNGGPVGLFQEDDTYTKSIVGRMLADEVKEFAATVKERKLDRSIQNIDRFTSKSHFVTMQHMYVSRYTKGVSAWVHLLFRGRVGKHRNVLRKYSMHVTKSFGPPFFMEDTTNAIEQDNEKWNIVVIANATIVKESAVKKFVTQQQEFSDNLYPRKVSVLVLIDPLIQFSLTEYCKSFTRVDLVIRADVGELLYELQKRTDAVLIYANLFTQFSTFAIERIVSNTRKGEQFYSPIIVQPCDTTVICPPSKMHSARNNQRSDSGAWRHGDYSVLAVHGRDAASTACNTLDTTVLFNCLLETGLSAFRVKDPTIWHQPTSDFCSRLVSESTRADCMRRDAEYMGSLSDITKMYDTMEDSLAIEIN